MGQYPLESLQIYFNASLEIQRELLSKGYRVPLETPVPIIYGDMGAYIQPNLGAGPLKVAILDPTRYGRTYSLMHWTQNGRHVRIPPEHGDLVIELGAAGDATLRFKFSDSTPGYHLEKASYRSSANPNLWNNWAMFYTSIDSLARIVTDLAKHLGPLGESTLYWTHEKLPKGGGQEDTYYASLDSECTGVSLNGYTLCLGCWDHTLDYFAIERSGYGGRGFPTPQDNLDLRIVQQTARPVNAKIGVARITGKSPQFMFKFATFSKPTLKIQGINREGKPITIPGKPRGTVQACSHSPRDNSITLDAQDFLRVSLAAQNLFFDKQDVRTRNVSCAGRTIRRAEWFL